MHYFAFLSFIVRENHIVLENLNTDNLYKSIRTVNNYFLLVLRLRSESSASNFSIFSGKWRLAHHTNPITAITIVTVIRPSQKGSWNILSLRGLYGIRCIRFSHFVPSHQAWHLHKNPLPFSRQTPRFSQGLDSQGLRFLPQLLPTYPVLQWHLYPVSVSSHLPKTQGSKSQCVKAQNRPTKRKFIVITIQVSPRVR